MLVWGISAFASSATDFTHNTLSLARPGVLRADFALLLLLLLVGLNLWGHKAHLQFGLFEARAHTHPGPLGKVAVFAGFTGSSMGPLEIGLRGRRKLFFSLEFHRNPHNNTPAKPRDAEI